MLNSTNQHWFKSFLAVLSGAGASFAFAPYSIWPLAVFTLTILLILIARRKPGQAFFTGWLWGMGLFGPGLSWVHVSIDTFGGVPPGVSVLLLALLSAYLALFPATFSLLVSRMWPTKPGLQLLVAAPVFWIATEWLRGWLFTGLPWLWLGYSQIDSPLAGYAPVGGVELLNAIVAFLAAGFAYLWFTRKSIVLIPVAAICVGGYLLNNINWVTPKAGSETRLALIQGNIAQEKKWLPSERWPTIEKYARLSQQNFSADSVIWPEAAIPAYEYELPNLFQLLDKMAKNTNTAIITGVLNRVDNTTFYNSILVLGKNGKNEYQRDVHSTYHKHHLLPFGEFVPFEAWLRPLAPIFNLPNSAFTRGDYIQKNIYANGRYLVAALCYEIIFGEQLRDNLTPQTDFILTLSNDAWFGTSIGPLQHMEIARMRALELGKPLIRSTNNGVTAVTDAKGKIVAQIPQFEVAVLTTTIKTTAGQTPYAKWGNRPVYLFAFLALLIAWFLERKFRR